MVNEILAKDIADKVRDESRRETDAGKRITYRELMTHIISSYKIEGQEFDEMMSEVGKIFSERKTKKYKNYRPNNWCGNNFTERSLPIGDRD